MVCLARYGPQSGHSWIVGPFLGAHLSQEKGACMIRLAGLNKTFLPGTPDARPLLQDFHLHIQTGEFVIFLGANGAGKSTLFHLLAGTESVNRGQIWIDGIDVTTRTE